MCRPIGAHPGSPPSRMPPWPVPPPWLPCVPRLRRRQPWPRTGAMAAVRRSRPGDKPWSVPPPPCRGSQVWSSALRMHPGARGRRACARPLRRGAGGSRGADHRAQPHGRRRCGAYGPHQRHRSGGPVALAGGSTQPAYVRGLGAAGRQRLGPRRGARGEGETGERAVDGDTRSVLERGEPSPPVHGYTAAPQWAAPQRTLVQPGGAPVAEARQLHVR
jgi:hypothetical protein